MKLKLQWEKQNKTLGKRTGSVSCGISLFLRKNILHGFQSDLLVFHPGFCYPKEKQRKGRMQNGKGQGRPGKLYTGRKTGNA